MQLSTTDLYLLVVVVVVVGLGAAMWKASRLSAFVERGQPLDSWWLGKPWVSSVKIDWKRGRRVLGRSLVYSSILLNLGCSCSFSVYFSSVLVRIVAVRMHFAHGYLVAFIVWEGWIDLGLCLIGSLSAVTAA